MSEQRTSNEVLENVELSEDASPYILLQRIDTQRWNPSNLLPEHKRPFDGLYHNFLMEIESSVRHETICGQYLRQMQTEFEELKPHLPEQVDRLVDIGCGMGGIDLFLREHFREQNPEVVLFDKSKVSEEVYYQFFDDAAFYNSLETARENLTDNGIPEDRVRTVEATPSNLQNLGQVDICLSLYSWGFHYPVDTYLDEVRQVLSPDGGAVLDLRKETGDVNKHTNDLEQCEQAFQSLETIKDEHKYKRVLLEEPRKATSEESDETDPAEVTQPEEEPAVAGVV